MSERLIDFFDEALRQHFGSGIGSAPGIRRVDVEKLLSDDDERRLALGRLTALEWGSREAVGSVAITSERLLVTHHGLVYLAGLKAPGQLLQLHYVATPPSLLDAVFGRLEPARMPPDSVAAVDNRLGHELHFLWPLDTRLRRMLAAAPVLRLEPTAR